MQAIDITYWRTTPMTVPPWGWGIAKVHEPNPNNCLWTVKRAKIRTTISCMHRTGPSKFRKNGHVTVPPSPRGLHTGQQSGPHMHALVCMQRCSARYGWAERGTEGGGGDGGSRLALPTCPISPPLLPPPSFFPTHSSPASAASLTPVPASYPPPPQCIWSADGGLSVFLGGWGVPTGFSIHTCWWACDGILPQ